MLCLMLMVLSVVAGRSTNYDAGAADDFKPERHECKQADDKQPICFYDWNTTKEWPMLNWTQSNKFCMNYIKDAFLLSLQITVPIDQLLRTFRLSNSDFLQLQPDIMFTRSVTPVSGFEPGEQSYGRDSELCGALQISTEIFSGDYFVNIVEYGDTSHGTNCNFIRIDNLEKFKFPPQSYSVVEFFMPSTGYTKSSCPLYSEYPGDSDYHLSSSVNNNFMVMQFDDPEKYYLNLSSSGLISTTLSKGLVQGYHNCSIWNFKSPSQTYDRNVYKNIRTDYLYATINYSQPVLWTDMYSFVTFNYIKDWISNPHIQKWMSWLNSTDGYLDKIMKIDYRGEFEIMLDVKISVYSQNVARPMKRRIPRQVFQDLQSEEGKEDTTNPEEVETKKFLSSNKGCYKEIVRLGSDAFYFNVGLANDEAFSDILCNWPAFPPKAKAACRGNFIYGYSWVLTEVLNCTSIVLNEADKSSNVTKSLLEIFRKDTADYGEILNMTKKLIAGNSTSSTIQPNDISLVAAILQKSNSDSVLINSNSANVLISIIDELLNSPVEKIQQAQNRTGASLSILNSMERLMNKFMNNESSEDINITWSYKNLIAHFHDSKLDNHHNLGFGLLKTKTTQNSANVIYGDDVFRKGSNHSNSSSSYDGWAADLEVALMLPDEVYKRTSYVDEDGNNDVMSREINSVVIKSVVKGRNISNLSNKRHFSNPTCVYARYESNEIHWLTDGLKTIYSGVDDSFIECESDHLTNFAVLAGFRKEEHSKAVGDTLQWVSMVGMIVSIVCLLLVITGQIIFKKFRRGQYHIALLNLSISLICVNLIIIFQLDKKQLSESSSASCSSSSSSSSSFSWETIRCIVVTALLHYFLLVSFLWMLIEAILQYLNCWLAKEAFYFAFLLPLALVILANTCMFVMIIKGISCDRPKGMITNQSQSQLVWLQVQVALCCFVIMGLTWTFAFFAYGKASVVMYFLFAIFNSLQGLFIFLLFNLREKLVRQAWRSLIRKPVEYLPFSTTSTSNNTNTFRLTINSRSDNERKKVLSTELNFLKAASSESYG
ncbi:hypothetical protein HELRODRAFT_180146 [Helobdella robusta]|uniref:G-protein coupled receptors family 2 profile 2 domain-containing protein n=1 Tax=Helobdella robusta TaxID=6412 RepID=T1FFI6_HELRO|nr:hypothetical protein HELRODRAFT_180146 [Helobdella robusta]ESN94800.1 hypothetical protein HELRODRAFT_180146 [Helobdella robusta]